MTAPDVDTAARQFDDFIKMQWQDLFRREVHVKLDSGARYVPNGGSQGVSLLRKNVNAFHAAIRLWSGPDAPNSSTDGYDRIVDQAGVRYTWEWHLIDPSRPWAAAVPAEVRERVEADLARRDRNARSRAQAQAAAAHQAGQEEDDRLIAVMNGSRVSQGRPPLSEAQEASVRDNRRRQRASS